MYINTFKYTPKDVSCQLCTEYVKKLGCTALRCPWLAGNPRPLVYRAAQNAPHHQGGQPAQRRAGRDPLCRHRRR